MKMLTTFHFQSHKGDRVTIWMDNRPVTRLKGAKAAKFMSRVELANHDTQQLIMAKATGNFKRGNEKN